MAIEFKCFVSLTVTYEATVSAAATYEPKITYALSPSSAKAASETYPYSSSPTS